MSTFIVEPTFRNLHDRTRDRVVPVLVDTGSTWTMLPKDTVDALGCTPISIVLVTLEGQELPTICLIGPPGGPGVLGAVTLEEFALAVDPVARRLVPVTGYGMPASHESLIT